MGQSENTQKVPFFKHHFKAFLAIFRAKYIYEKMFPMKNRIRKSDYLKFLNFRTNRYNFWQFYQFLGSIFTNLRSILSSETTRNRFFSPNYILSTLVWFLHQVFKPKFCFRWEWTVNTAPYSLRPHFSIVIINANLDNQMLDVRVNCYDLIICEFPLSWVNN